MARDGLTISIPSTSIVLATAILAAAKIWGGLSWPWWLILSPLLVLVGLAILFFAFVVAVLFAGGAFALWLRRFR